MKSRVTPFAIMGSGLLLFTVIWIGLKTAALDTFDQSVLEIFRYELQEVGGNWIIEVLRDLTALGSNSVLALFTLIATALLAASGRLKVAGVLIFVLLTVAVTSSLLKHFVDRPRPSSQAQSAHVFTKSFPSAHAMHSSAAYLCFASLFLLYRKVTSRQKKVVFFTSISLTAIVGLTRLNLAVHWPSDIIAGWCLGAVFAALFYVIAKKIQPI